MDLEKIKDDLIVLLKEAGEIIKEGYCSEKQVSSKANERDLLTKYDVKVNRMIVEHLEKNYPEITIISEEEPEVNRDSAYAFHVDPIDGTTNFVKNVPAFLTGIGLSQDDEVILCVTYNPILDEMFWAIKDKGAYLNDKKITVSQRDMAHADVELDSHDYEFAVRCFKLLNNDAMRVRADKSMHYELTGIAYGRFEALIANNNHSWDVCHYLLVKEAGGKVTTFEGKDFKLSDDTILVSNGIIHEELLEIVQKGKK